MADSTLSAGETSTLTITFSEAVTGFDNSDLTLANGTLTTVASTDGGMTWTGTFTPTDNTQASANVITVGTETTDLAGNRLLAGGFSADYSIDTLIVTTAIPPPVDEVPFFVPIVGSTSLYPTVEVITGIIIEDIGGVDESAEVDDSEVPATVPTAIELHTAEILDDLLTVDEVESPPVNVNSNLLDLTGIIAIAPPFDIGDDYADRETDRYQSREHSSSRETALFIDFENLELNLVESFVPELITLEDVVRSDSFYSAVREVGENLDRLVDKSRALSQLNVAAVSGFMLSASSSIVSWLLRAGSLLASFISVLPLWRQFDPLPILAVEEQDEKIRKKDPEDAIETIFGEKGEAK
ncbi:MAG: Ig-like domain-containing protein, partial [Pseudomonadales bacterium]|nr:Ig-like domain-containing protein [Pseudomonadales bacterium]